MNETKNYEDLELKDDFVFAKAMRNPKLCKQLLELILEVKIDRIEYPVEQKVIDITADARSVRLDVYVQDGKNTVYNIEMQTTNPKNLPKRSRYYQGRYVYTFQNICLQDRTLLLEDETTKVFLNPYGSGNDIKTELKNFLIFLSQGISLDPFTRELEKEVEKVRSNEDWRREFMTLLMRDNEKKEEGRVEGRETEIFDSVFENDYSVERGAEKLNISKEEFEAKYQSWREERNRQ